MGNRRSFSRAPPAGLLRKQAQIAGISIRLHGAAMATYGELQNGARKGGKMEQRATNTELTLSLPHQSQGMWWCKPWNGNNTHLQWNIPLVAEAG
ncbi:hypothetical protein FKM82_028047 [Ascaphus truei]